MAGCTGPSGRRAVRASAGKSRARRRFGAQCPSNCCERGADAWLATDGTKAHTIAQAHFCIIFDILVCCPETRSESTETGRGAASEQRRGTDGSRGDPGITCKHQQSPNFSLPCLAKSNPCAAAPSKQLSKDIFVGINGKVSEAISHHVEWRYRRRSCSRGRH